MTVLGYQIPYFTYPGVGPDRLFETVARQAETADRCGFDTVMVMDHLYQLPMIAPPTDPMLECYTLLSALAGRTRQARLSALVTGNTYRNPAFLAKVVTTLDIVSGGRAQLGIGAGWFELEHVAYGYDFGTFTERFEKLEEALRIILPMLRGERPTMVGRHYSVSDAINEPPPISRIPVMIGGSGERKTLRLVARYGDESNLTCSVDEVPRKLDALARHCDDIGRDRSEITVSLQQICLIAPTHEQAMAAAAGFFGARGIDLTSMDDGTRDRLLAAFVVGGPDEVGEQLARRLESGVDGFTLSLPVNGHELEPIELLGRVAAEVVGAKG